MTIKHSKTFSSKLTGISLRKTQKVIQLAQEHGLNPMLHENTMTLKHVLSLLACGLLLSFLATAGSLPLCVQCLKLVSIMMVCLKQTEYYVYRHGNKLHKLWLEV